MHECLSLQCLLFHFSELALETPLFLFLLIRTFSLPACLSLPFCLTPHHPTIHSGFFCLLGEMWDSQTHSVVDSSSVILYVHTHTYIFVVVVVGHVYVVDQSWWWYIYFSSSFLQRQCDWEAAANILKGQAECWKQSMLLWDLCLGKGRGRLHRDLFNTRLSPERYWSWQKCQDRGRERLPLDLLTPRCLQRGTGSDRNARIREGDWT